MKVIKQGHAILYPNIHHPSVAEALVKRIEAAGRTCYKSEDKITSDSAVKFVGKIRDLGHESVLEHETIQVKFITDRGVTHELVRHRIGIAFSQESTRYCDYGGGDVVFINPVWYDESQPDTQDRWTDAMLTAERYYKDLRSLGWSPQQARAVLPNSLKTEIVVTANIREWRHIFRLRCSPRAHPQMRSLMIPLLKDMSLYLPILFQDLP